MNAAGDAGACSSSVLFIPQITQTDTRKLHRLEGCCMEVGRLSRRMRRGRWRGLPRAVVGATLEPRAMQTVVPGRHRARVPEHHVLRERVVQPLQHGMQ